MTNLPELSRRPSVADLLRTPATVVWLVLIVAIAVSWALGVDHGGEDQSMASVIILLVTFVKVRLIGLWFMELREAPMPLRTLFETYCIIVYVMMTALFLLV